MWMGLNEWTITRISTDPSIGKGYFRKWNFEGIWHHCYFGRIQISY